MGVLNAVAEFELDLLVERTQAGLQRAKAEGKALGRPSALTEQQQQQEVLAKRAEGGLSRRPSEAVRGEPFGDPAGAEESGVGESLVAYCPAFFT